MCQEAQNLAEGVFRGEPRPYDEVVNVSPGTSKSTIWSVMLCPWAWTRMISFRSINVSYSFPLAMDLARKSRDVVMSDKYQACFSGVNIREDQKAKHHFANTKGGYRYAVGVGGSVMGMHGHMIVVDDPINPKQAVSELDLNTANTWLKDTLSTRKVDKLITPTVLVMQRLRQGDPTDEMLDKNKKRPGSVRHVCLPAEITPAVRPRALKERYENGLMDPVRLSRRVLEEEKDKGEYYYSGQFLQRPVPPGGGKFKINRIKYGSPPPKFKRRIRFWDKAGTSGGGAYTVGVLMGLDELERFWLLDVIREQLDSAEREQLILNTAENDGYSVRVGVEQEPGSGGKESAEATVRRLAGYRIVVVKVGKSEGDKLDRADPLSSQVNKGNFYIPGKVDKWTKRIMWDMCPPWLRDYLDEMRYFPFSRYMDQIDASSGAFNWLARKRKKAGGLWKVDRSDYR